VNMFEAADKSSLIYEFGDFEFDRRTCSLSRSGTRVKLGNRASEVLRVLLEKAGSDVSRAEIERAVWGGAAIEPNNLDQQIHQLREVLGDNPKMPRFIATNPNGFRFIGTVPNPQRRGRAAARSRNRTIGGMVFGLAVIGLVAWLGWKLITRHPRIEVETSSTDAKNYYLKALEYERMGDDEQALFTFRQAVAIDPEFAQAYLEAADIQTDIDDVTGAKESIAAAQKFISRLPRRYQLRLEGLSNELAGNPELAIQKYQLITDLYPEYTESWMWFVPPAMAANRFDEVRLALRKCLSLDSLNPICHYQRMYLSILENDFDGVIRRFDALQSNGINYGWFHELVGIALVGKGDVSGARRQFEQLRAVRAGSFRVHGTIHSRTSNEWLADLALYIGDVRAAIQMIREDIADARDDEERGRHQAYLARVELLVGGRAMAATLANEAAKNSKDVRILMEAAEVLASAGVLKQASELLARAKTDPNVGKAVLPTEHYIRGMEALRHNDTETAKQELMASAKDNIDAQYELGQFLESTGDFRGAASAFQRVTLQKGIIFAEQVPALWPLAQLELGRCSEKLGDRAGAVNAYSAFLSTWTAAPLNDARIQQARTLTQTARASPN